MRQNNPILIVSIILLAFICTSIGLAAISKVQFEKSAKGIELKMKPSEIAKMKSIVKSLTGKAKLNRSDFSEATLLGILKRSFPDGNRNTMNRRMFYLSYSILKKLNRNKLGPQPEPPDKKLRQKFVKPGTKKGFTPQPEPPGKSIKGNLNSPGKDKMFNPQPEPPAKSAKGSMQTPGKKKMFNPQPEPPAQNTRGIMGSIMGQLNSLTNKYHNSISGKIRK